MTCLDLSTCDKMADMALEKAQQFGKPASVAIVDAGGHLICFKRSDKGKIGHIDIAISKAWTAVCFQDETENYEQRVQPGQPAFGLQWSNNGQAMFIRGGVPIKVSGEIIGGIGMSGGTGDEDVACCRAGMELL